MIYDIGSEPEVIYILRSGKLVVETLIEIDDYHKYPIVSIDQYNSCYSRIVNGKFWPQRGRFFTK